MLSDIITWGKHSMHVWYIDYEVFGGLGGNMATV